MPPGPVHQNGGMRLAGHTAADLVEMQLHGMGIGPWQHERCTGSTGRTDGSEQIGVLVALVCRLAWPGSFFGPLPHLPVLLANTCFVLEPDLNWFVSRQMAYMGLERVGEVFLKASMTLAFCAGWRGLALMWEKPMATRSLETVRSL